MSSQESLAAVATLAEIRQRMTVDEFARLAFCALAILGWSAPEALRTVIDGAEKWAEQ
jgi:hypothetical protein